jgi:hypothetical protein
MILIAPPVEVQQGLPGKWVFNSTVARRDPPDEVELAKKGCFMLRFLDSIPYPLLIIAALLLLLAPFEPMPHVVEKLIMIKEGTLRKPIDIFDLVFHLIPTVLLFLKVIGDRAKGG